jgi:hypothetical protein
MKVPPDSRVGLADRPVVLDIEGRCHTRNGRPCVDAIHDGDYHDWTSAQMDGVINPLSDMGNHG